MGDRNASPSAFGWDFQANAAILLMIENIKQAEKIRVEGADEDIEITLHNKEKIYAQVKAVERPENYTHVVDKLAAALETLNLAAKNGNGKLFTYITNSPNPFNNQKIMNYFTGNTHLDFDELPSQAQKRVLDLLKEKPNEDKVYAKRIDKAEYAKEAEAAYQQINDLIRRFQLIDAAIVESNAKTEVNTSYGTFTVAGAISLRSRLRGMDAYDGEADFEGRLKNKLNNEYSERVQFCDMKNGQLQSTAESMRLSILGRDAKAKDDKPLGVVDAYMKENTTELVDPLDVKKKVDMLEEKRNILLTELDTQIKVSNATTFIEIA